MDAAKVLLLGDPALRDRSVEVEDFDNAAFRDGLATLASTLDAFRAQRGFGRAISAAQIGIAMRFIAVNLGQGTFFVVNPVVTWTSEETFTMWDDCMSFPDLLVRVTRADSMSLAYVDENGRAKTWERMGRAESELLQHEIDHLDGVLAVDRAMDRESLVLREVFEKNRGYYRSLVDYTIE
ncbi:MAG TPA: peptide deformylase [Thermoanaerobaculia bacterium]|nr:peptide deformylase [Thermoanaerobaculia bacterium]